MWIGDEKYRTCATENKTRKCTSGVALGGMRVLRQTKATGSAAIGRIEIWCLAVELQITRQYAGLGPGPKFIGPVPGSLDELAK